MIAPLKQAQSAFRHNIDPVSRGGATSNWPITISYALRTFNLLMQHIRLYMKINAQVDVIFARHAILPAGGNA